MYRRFHDIDKVAIGDIIEVGFLNSDERPVRWRKSGIKHIEGFVSEMNGKVSQRDGQTFGLMVTNNGERIFVPPALMNEQPVDREGEKSCMAVMGKDKKGKKGWKALRWLQY